MLTIPADIILEKNKLYSSEAFVELLEWQKTGGTVRIANYNENITWGGYTWTRFRFDGGGEQDTGGDSAETITIKVSAIDKVIQGYLESLTNGGIGDTVIYRRVHTSDLTLGAALSATFEIVDVDAGPSSEWVTFTLGQENFFLSQFPANVFRRNVCRYRPSMTAVCPYVNNALCDRTFSDCVYFGQQAVFGGQPGIPGGAFNLPPITDRGSIAAISSLSGVLTRVSRAVSGSLSAISTVTGDLFFEPFEAKILAGTIAGVSSVSGGPPDRSRSFSGSLSSSSAISAAPLNRSKLLVGLFAAAAGVTGDLTKTSGATKSLAGSIAATSSVSSGALKRAKIVSGSLAAASVVIVLPLKRIRSFIGLSEAVATVTGDLFFSPYSEKILAGTIAGASSVSGVVLERARAIQGGLDAVSVFDGNLQMDPGIDDLEDTSGAGIDDTGGTPIEDTAG